MPSGSRKYSGMIVLAASLFIGVFLAGDGMAGHFPAPDTNTNRSADYLVNFRINGVPAEAGDEIAFFNPRGVLCGRLEAPAIPSDYYPVAIYGDEDAADGEFLTLKVWDAGSERELSENDLKLIPGPAMGKDYYQPATVPPVWRVQDYGYVLHVDSATHFTVPAGSPQVCNYIGNIVIEEAPAVIGDEVAVFDGNGVLCGQARIGDGGKFSLSVYGDEDPQASPDEGAVSGETLLFKVWQQSTGREFSGADLVLAAGDTLGSEFYLSSEVPPVWSADLGYSLDISVSSGIRGDIDGDRDVDLADAVIALRAIVRASPTSVPIRKGADVDGDGKIGVTEAIYIIQELSGLRL